MQISITRALAELKLLDKKIKDKTESLVVAATVTKDHNKELRESFVQQESSKLAQVKDFIIRRVAIKTSIVASNAETDVVIGEKTMKVAAAIERKSSIENDKQLLTRLRTQYYGNKQNVEKQNEAVKNRADKQAESALGGEMAREKGEEYTTLFNAYYERNKSELINVDGIEALIEKMQDDIDEFEKEVDFVLSESNTKTMIEI